MTNQEANNVSLEIFAQTLRKYNTNLIENLSKKYSFDFPECENNVSLLNKKRSSTAYPVEGAKCQNLVLKPVDMDSGDVNIRPNNQTCILASSKTETNCVNTFRRKLRLNYGTKLTKAFVFSN